MSFLDNMRTLNAEHDAVEQKRHHEEEVRKQAERDVLIAEAAAIIKAIEPTGERVAREGKKGFTVMTLNRIADYPLGAKTGYGATLSRSDIGLKAGIVYDHIVEHLKVTPVIEWNHDGVGINDWFEMKIKWQ